MSARISASSARINNDELRARGQRPATRDVCPPPRLPVCASPRQVSNRGRRADMRMRMNRKRGGARTKCRRPTDAVECAPQRIGQSNRQSARQDKFRPKLKLRHRPSVSETQQRRATFGTNVRTTIAAPFRRLSSCPHVAVRAVPPKTKQSVPIPHNCIGHNRALSATRANRCTLTSTVTLAPAPSPALYKP